jgi:peptide/nickel transport system substrate-binding protein
MRDPFRGRVLVLVLAVMSVVACTPNGSSEGSASAAEGSGGTLRVGIVDWFNGYDPQALRNASVEFELGRCCLSRTLLSYNGRPTEEGGATLRPDLAKELPTVSDDGLTWTFHIKEGLHYGPPLQDVEIVAQDFIRSMKRNLAPVPPTYPFGGDYLGGYFASYFDGEIEGTREYVQGNVDNISGLEATDDHTLVVHLTSPTGDLGYRFAQPPTAPLPPNPADPSAALGVAEGHEDHYGRFQVSSGPYMIEGSEDMDFSLPPDKQQPPSGFGNFTFTLVRNPSWEPSSDDLRAAYADRIVIVASGDEELAQRMVVNGDLDLLFDTSPHPDAVRELRSDPEMSERVYFGTRDLINFISMRLALPPFDDLHVRKAINYATDKQALLDRYQDSGRIVAITGHIAPDSEENNLLVDYDPYRTQESRGSVTKARAEMALSTYDRDGDGVCDASACKNVKVLVRSEIGPGLPTSFTTNLRRIGITLRPRSLDEESFFNFISNTRNKVPMWIGDGWTKDYPSASTFFPPLFTGKGNVGEGNWSFVGATPADLRRLGYEPIRGIPNVDDRINECLDLLFDSQVECWAQLDQYMMENVVPWVPLFNELTVRTVSERVESLSFDQFVSMPALERIELTPEAAESPAPLPTPSPTAVPTIPEGTYTATITAKDALARGAPRSGLQENTGRFELTLDDGYYRFEQTDDRPYFAPVFTGIYEGDGNRVTLETITPTFADGERIDMRWKVVDGGLQFKVLATHPADPGFLAYGRATFESHLLKPVEE